MLSLLALALTIELNGLKLCVKPRYTYTYASNANVYVYNMYKSLKCRIGEITESDFFIFKWQLFSKRLCNTSLACYVT